VTPRSPGEDPVVNVRRFRATDAPAVWALADLLKIGDPADQSIPVPLPPASESGFPDLADIPAHFLEAGGEFLIAEIGGHLVGMGGIRPTDEARAEVKRLRVHPAVRRQGVGRALMAALERRAAELGKRELHLDSADQPDSIAFYLSLGYREVDREPSPYGDWTTVYYAKGLETEPAGRA
jgi:GNAT superfamily N-acetyltransferase